MSEYGMIVSGFKPKPFQQIINSIMQAFKEYFGHDIDSSAMNPLVRISEVYARELEQLWVQQGHYFDAQQIQTASNRFLNDIAIQMDLEKKQASKASTYLTFHKTISDVVEITEGTRIDNNSSVFLKEFEVLEDIELTNIFVIQKGVAGATDAINGYPGFTGFFDVEEVIWVSDNIDGSVPYTNVADYLVSVSGVYAVGIDWSPGGVEPVTDAVYYVKVGNYKAYVYAEAVSVGAVYNAVANEIFHLQSLISGIGSVLNGDNIVNGSDDESDLQLRRRLLNANNHRLNDGQVEMFIGQIHQVLASKVYTRLDGPHFRTIIHVDENSDAGLMAIYNMAIQKTEELKAAGTNSCAIIPVVRGAGAGGTDVFSIPYSQLRYTSGVYQIDWVSSDIDGFTRYIAGTDYVAYADYNNRVDWSLGGVEPAAGQTYWVKCVKSVEIAETFPVTIHGRLILNSGYSLDDVSDDLFVSINEFIRTIGISSSLLFTDISKIILSHPGVKSLDNFYMDAVCRLIKGTAAGIDTLPINGSGRYDSGDLDIIWVNLAKDNSSTSYGVAVLNWYIYTAGNMRGIDWSPVGAEPTSGWPYWVNFYFKGDITPPEGIVVTLDEVDFTL